MRKDNRKICASISVRNGEERAKLELSPAPLHGGPEGFYRVRLARRWGADEEHARRAAILHDCTKYLELDEQLQLCAKYGIVLDELEQQAVKLLHSKTGACVARHVYGRRRAAFLRPRRTGPSGGGACPV